MKLTLDDGRTVSVETDCFDTETGWEVCLDLTQDEKRVSAYLTPAQAHQVASSLDRAASKALALSAQP